MYVETAFRITFEFCIFLHSDWLVLWARSTLTDFTTVLSCWQASPEGKISPLWHPLRTDKHSPQTHRPHDTGGSFLTPHPLTPTPNKTSLLVLLSLWLVSCPPLRPLIGQPPSTLTLIGQPPCALTLIGGLPWLVSAVVQYCGCLPVGRGCGCGGLRRFCKSPSFLPSGGGNYHHSVTGMSWLLLIHCSSLLFSSFMFLFFHFVIHLTAFFASCYFMYCVCCTLTQFPTNT